MILSNCFVQYFSHSSPPSSGTGGAFSRKNPFALETTIILDYQNVHITGAKLLGSQYGNHEHYIDPIRFAETLVEERNSRIREGYAIANVSKVLVYRGLPSNIHNPTQYARNLTQAAFWERDKRVIVTHRPLRYVFARDDLGKVLLDAKGKKIPISKQEIRSELVPVWNTRLDANNLDRSRDTNDYSKVRRSTV